MSAWLRKRDGSIIYVERDGVGGWFEVPPRFWPDPLPVGLVPPKVDSGEPASKQPTPGAVRQFLREIGRRGGLQRCRNFARRFPRGWIRFQRRYRCNPRDVKAAPMKANEEVRNWLRGAASRGGQARARKHSREQLRAWAASGGYAKAAKSKRACPPAQAIAGKQACEAMRQTC